nr:WhiB family transcriptional regulator [Rhodococcus rhodochrous]
MTQSSPHRSPVIPKNVTPETGWDWLHRARCKFFGIEIFFAPDKETPGEKARRERRARDTCAACPVQEICREHVLTRREQHGVWGGLTENERRR